MDAETPTVSWTHLEKSSGYMKPAMAHRDETAGLDVDGIITSHT
jgi:hypothetical protein